MVKIEEASSSSTHPWKYHVFLSFRGEDTRNNFTDHLCSALRQQGIITFMDVQLRRGEEISTALVQAIEQSRISIIVFSKNYASSKWCLDELIKILNCKESKQQMVRPVFYKVDPSDIRNHRKSFGEALANHERSFQGNLEKVQKWRKALSEAANLSGWTLSDKHSESDLIHDIVKEISQQVMKHTYLNEAKCLVGIESRLQDMNELLDVQSRDVRMVGIWGTGGIGKTTIAKAVYNSIAHKFEGTCFLESVGENSMCNGGLVKQQETLLFGILGREELKVTNSAEGMATIKERLCNKSVLLVLDDVNNLNQLENLAGGLDWFGTGSRIIITTRDRGLLVRHDIYLIYSVKKLDYHEAVELFSWSAFKRKKPLKDYVELTERAIGYARGLPLALTVLGSHLYGGSLYAWKATLDGFKSPEIQEILRVSYDALDVIVQQVFLDIACFFKGERTDYVIQVLEGCNLPEYGINVLVEKALINIDHGIIQMHDLLEEMGKDIVYQESPNDPGERSRLWFHDDVYHVLTENKGTSKITGIKVKLPEDSDVICLSGTTFSQMRNLRLFIHRAGSFSGVLDYLPNSLRVVDWPNYPFQALPSDFYPTKLAVLSMPGNVKANEESKEAKWLSSELSSPIEQAQEEDEMETINVKENVVIEEDKPEHSQGLLLFCFLLSSDFEFRKHELVQLWIAEGLNMNESEGERMEDAGIRHFDSLESRGFFVRSRCDFKVGFDSVFSVPMYSPSNFFYKVNPVELSVLENRSSHAEYFRAVNGKLDGASESTTQHLSLTYDDIDEMILGVIPKFKNLRTLLLLSGRGYSIKRVPGDLFLSLNFLTTLKLSRTLISGLPSSVGDVKLLRYLDVSYTPIRRLPESIGSLDKLQTLKLIGCKQLSDLPRSVQRLTALRHLDFDIIGQLDFMPAHLGNLIDLQTLSAFLVDKDDGRSIRELKNLNGLGGALRIFRLENVLSKADAVVGDLPRKKHLQRLDLRWTSLFVENIKLQEEILDSLRPHSGLKELQILFYNGTKLPAWLSRPSFTGLVVMTLYKCENCELLPSIGQLPELKFLSIVEMNKVKEIDGTFFRSTDEQVDESFHAFPKLEILEVDIMLNLKEWKEVKEGDLPSLIKLTMESCPELVALPSFSCLKSLKYFEVRHCRKLLSLDRNGLPTSLESLIIRDCPELKEWCDKEGDQDLGQFKLCESCGQSLV